MDFDADVGAVVEARGGADVLLVDFSDVSHRRVLPRAEVGAVGAVVAFKDIVILIALSGDPGNSTGPHLHFEYHPPGPADPSNGVPGASAAINPIPFLRAHGLIA